MMKKRKYVEKLARALLMQQQILEETLKSIILASGCQDVISITEDSLEYFSSEDIQEQVEG
jgi:hypothetical protein